MPVVLTSAWANGISGSWNTGSDWTEGVPQSSQASTALITVKGTYSVTSSQVNSVGNLEMQKTATLAIVADSLHILTGTGAGALDGTIAVGDETALGLGIGGASTTFDNNGAINITGADGSAILVSGNVTLNGKGKINLQDGNSQIVSDGSAATLTNNNIISGTGTIGDPNLTFVNAANGKIGAVFPMEQLTIDAAGFTNAGLLEAIAGELTIKSDIEQEGKGQIKAALAQSGQDAIILGYGSTITGGTISIVKGSTMVAIQGDDAIDALTKPIANAGTIETDDLGSLTISSAVKNASSGGLQAQDNTKITVDGTVTGGTAQIFDTSSIAFDGPSSAKVTFEGAGMGIAILDLGDATKFTGTVAGMSSPNEVIDLENIPFANANVNFAKGLLTVTDSVNGTTDKIKIVGSAGPFNKAEASDGSTLISDPPENPTNAVPLLAQSMASFAASSAVAASGTANPAYHDHSSEFLAAPAPHHG